jgi:6-phosphofructokinase 1
MSEVPELEGNLLVAQSGGPTSVINASIAGVVFEAGKFGCIEEIYGGRNGILGILNEDLLDLNEEKANAITGLKFTPAAALGTCRYKIDFTNNPEQAAKDFDRLFEVFEVHNIRYFFYAGGNDSQDTAHKIHLEAEKRNYEMRVIGIPKTIDNDLPHTDHCPGYGSVIKYNAATVMEVAMDVKSMATDSGSCCIIEVMGRAAGWIAAGTVLAKKKTEDAPHVILLPERTFDEQAFLNRVKSTVATFNYCIVVVGEGLKDASGKEISADSEKLDAFGHPILAGVADTLRDLVEEKLGTKTRTVKLGYAQRAAAHFASRTDAEESFACGAAAVNGAMAGHSGKMVKIVRTSSNPYTWTTDLHDLAEIANVENLIPEDWISDDGLTPNEKFEEYARPLIEGENKIPMEGGLPKYAELQRFPVDKKLSSR